MGNVSGGMRCMKYLLFTFNLFFWLSGTAVLSLGLWLRFDSETTTIFSGDHCPTSFYVGVYTLIATGALMMLVGFLGCCGVVHESQCLLGAFFMCLLVIFVAEITAGVWGFLNKHEILQEMSGYYSKSLQAYKMTGAGNRTLRAIHSVLQCCGDSLPDPNVQHLCPTLQVSVNCTSKLKEFFNSKLYMIGVVGIGIAGIMTFRLMFFPPALENCIYLG
ncbi:CD9 antigen-like isoform X2 [Stegostoma tigrinum]|uniref:CD9 antigen-like isoform X2 n=1 Tax=Stegostoma tigrinum TaxID=3053191 RepID=UPI0028705FE4|nr:CD9 antigen-like isoform X2 [Stegostoma tigrinum]